MKKRIWRFVEKFELFHDDNMIEIVFDNDEKIAYFGFESLHADEDGYRKQMGERLDASELRSLSAMINAAIKRLES